MITRRLGFPRLFTTTTTQRGGMTAQALGPSGRWTRGTIYTMTPPQLGLPAPGGVVMGGYGYAMDPSDPKTWRRPVRFT
jgi:hypothetical protein